MTLVQGIQWEHLISENNLHAMIDARVGYM